MQGSNGFLTRKEVAKHFNISFPTLKKLIDNGKIPAYRIGINRIYFKPEDVQSALQPVERKKTEVSDGR